MKTADSASRKVGIVDSHAHIWTLDTTSYPWQPTFGIVPGSEASPEELVRAMDACDVAQTLLVQASAYGRDHRFLLDAVRRWPEHFSAVALIDPRDADTAERAVELVQAGCVGFRVNLSLDLEQAAAQAAAPTWGAVAELGVPICLRVAPVHHELAIAIVAGHPQAAFVVDHLALPDPAEVEEAIARLAQLSGYVNCHLKLAGLARLSTEGPPYRDMWPILSASLEGFGAARTMWGSDYPLEEGGVRGYADAIETMRALPFLEAEAFDDVMGGTAQRLWRLSDASGVAD